MRRTLVDKGMGFIGLKDRGIHRKVKITAETQRTQRNFFSPQRRKGRRGKLKVVSDPFYTID